MSSLTVDLRDDTFAPPHFLPSLPTSVCYPCPVAYLRAMVPCSCPRCYEEFFRCFIMVARSSVARARLLLYFAERFFFSRHTFSDVGKPTSPKLSHMTWLRLQQNHCYTDFFKVLPKRTGAEKPKICIFFVPSRKPLAP